MIYTSDDNWQSQLPPPDSRRINITGPPTVRAILRQAQGKIILTFVPVKGMAFVNGIEVTEDTK